MMQELRAWSGAHLPIGDVVSEPLGMIAYRSRAIGELTHSQLERLLAVAQDRNRSEGLTGVLIYDCGYFYQWLEGPQAALARVWDSIRCDSRHSDVNILRQQGLPKRFFKDWDMRLARRVRGQVDVVMQRMEMPRDLLKQLQIDPSALAIGDWDGVFADIVIPRIKFAHTGERLRAPSLDSVVWHAHRGAAAELARILLTVDAGSAERFIDRLVDDGAGVEGLYSEVFEPAARFLGGLWDEDRCDEFCVTLAMGRLQLEVRRLGGGNTSAVGPVLPGHTILVAQQPGETHGLTSAMCSELFMRDGWDVSCETPNSDRALRDILHEQWFDVLELSSSSALRRDQQLAAMRLSILAARSASRNPALTVIVDGRSFFERPQAYLDVGADFACRSCIDLVGAAERLVARPAANLANAKLPQVLQLALGH